MERLRRYIRPTLSILLIVVAGGIWLWSQVAPKPPMPQDIAAVDPMVRDLILEAAGIVESNPAVAKHWLQLGMVYEANSLEELAVECYQRSLSVPGLKAKAWYRLARTYEQLEQPDQVRFALRRVVEYADDYAPAYWRLGFEYLQRGEIDRAEALFKQGLTVDQDSLGSRIGQARVLLARDDVDRAVKTLEAVATQQPDDRYIRQLLGDGYRRQGRVERAQLTLAGALGAKPSFDDPWGDELSAYRRGYTALLGFAARALQENRLIDAIATLETLYARFPNRSPVLSNLALAYTDAGRFDDGIRICREGLRIEPNSAALHANLSRGLLNKRQLTQALEAADTAVAADGSAAAAHQVRAAVLTALEQYDAALEALDHAAELTAAEPLPVLAYLGVPRAPLIELRARLIARQRNAAKSEEGQE